MTPEEYERLYGAKGGATNAQNPGADPEKPYVQAGNTGGYLEGTGVTIGEGRSITPEQERSNIDAAIASGVPEGWARDYLGRNPGDSNRITEAYGSGQSGGGSDSSPTQQWNAQPAASSRSDDLYQQLLQRTQQGLDVDRNTPAIRAQADAFSANQERSRRNYLSDTAERMGPYASGALQGERRMASERAGIASGAFEAELVGREITARRDEIAQALSLLTGRVSAEDEMALRRELADLEAQLRREGYGLQRYGLDQGNDQFLRQLAQRQYEFDSSNPYF